MSSCVPLNQMFPTEAKVYGGDFDGGHAPFMKVRPYMTTGKGVFLFD